jgi:hypothetical protein
MDVVFDFFELLSKSKEITLWFANDTWHLDISGYLYTSKNLKSLLIKVYLLNS